jgi:hypothetical protein
MDRKPCNKCGNEKPCTAEFYSRDKAAKGGYSHRCKVCAAAAHKAWREGKNREEFLEEERRRHAALRANPIQKEKARLRLNKWRRDNPEKAKAQRHSQPHMKAERERARQATKINATPAWADREAIRAVYAHARKMTEETGIPHEVDHIIPLRGRTVTGLHVHQNLRVIPESENVRKGNRLMPELLGELS